MIGRRSPNGRSMVFFGIIVSIFCTAVRDVACQECIESGRSCSDDKNCCGGCCINSACIDTYESCLIRDDLCLNHYCPGGLVCKVYQPDCMGCAPTPYCKQQRN